MKKYTLAFGIVSIVTIGLLVCTLRRGKVAKRLVEISDAGYETAYDVLYPIQNKRFTRLFR